MGWYIGSGSNPVTTSFDGGFTSTDAYLSLSGEYYYQEVTSRLTVSVAVYKSLEDFAAGKRPIACTDLNNANNVIVPLTIEELSSGSFFDILVPKTKIQIEELVPSWSGSLYDDF